MNLKYNYLTEHRISYNTFDWMIAPLSLIKLTPNTYDQRKRMFSCKLAVPDLSKIAILLGLPPNEAA